MTNQDISVLKKQRATVKASCTRIRTYVDAIVAITPSISAQLEERRSKLEQYWSEYSAVQTQIEILEEGEASDRASFEEAFYALSARIRELLNPLQATRPAGIFSPSTSSGHGYSEPVNHVRLPKLDIPKFSGSYEEWFPFCDLFSSVIHNNPTLTSTQKFQYLKGSVVGDASDVIASLEIKDANYEIAWDALKERYDNKRVIVQNHIRAIMDLPKMVKENPTELRIIADGAAKHLRSLKALDRPTQYWDDVIVCMLSVKLDPTSSREWKNSLKGQELPTLKKFLDFLVHQYQMLEENSEPNVATTKASVKGAVSKVKHQSSNVATVKNKCNYCQAEHSIYHCKSFLALSVSQRISEIRKRKICLNCLRSSSHVASKCSSGTCKICHAKHNTLLHVSASSESSERDSVKPNEPKSADPPATVSTHASSSVGGSNTILSTAVLYAFDSQGSPKPCRALLDCGSQANFISKKFLSTLGVKPKPLNVSISGVNGSSSNSTQVAQLRLQSRLTSYTAVTECIVADRVTDKIPAFTLKRNTFNFPRNIKLADPQFHLSSEIDLLIGAELFWDLLCVGQIKASREHPMLQKTRLGWILAGPLGRSPQYAPKVQSFHSTVTNTQLHDQLGRFWQVEDDFDSAGSYNLEERLCEQHFLKNVSQTPQGRYIVKLPIKEHVMSKLGDSRETALKRLNNLEKRFKRNPELRIQYEQFIHEYLSLGHIRQIRPSPDERSISFYLPHHCVFKTSGHSTKLRVVFDASCKTSTGLSLNDALMVGPVIQHDLASILMRFRIFRYVIAADIIKMYRQILLEPSQTRLQRILWRDDPEADPSVYELLTVTYGTSSASFLATRCLKYLAEQHAAEYSVGSTCVKRDFYMDDMLTGADTIQELKQIRDETIQLLRLGAFELSKWASNCPEVLEAIGGGERPIVEISSDSDSSVLGIQWNQVLDTFQLTCNLEPSCNAISKRTILSEVSRLFDPLGLIGPIIVIAKLILQEIWKSGINWDESLPQDLHTRWSKLRSQLIDLGKLNIPRCVKFKSDPQYVQLHGFCDASQLAYGACIYVRTALGSGKYRSELLCSKSRVAPIKTISLPRLELCAALLLARLAAKVSEALNLIHVQQFLWSDSTIALSWITSPSGKWSVFVANRVGEIQRLTSIQDWHHVATSNNPADILSRGLNPQDLARSSMWWHGPDFLQWDDDCWPSSSFFQLEEGIPEMKGTTVTAVTIDQCVISSLLNKFSSLGKICRIIAYCLRLGSKRHNNEPSVVVSASEISRSLDIICKTVQKHAFPNEYKALRKGIDIESSSKILPLTPFMDKDGLIRAGGQLKNSTLLFDTRHPILLPRSHDLTRLIIQHEHGRNMDAGTQATMAAVRQRYWPLALRSSTRNIIQKCVRCFKARPRQSEALMGSLPASRVTVSRPFSRCGVDYAGPVILREGKRRNARNHKAYVAVFVCFTTKAVHIELVSDLTSNAFIAAFKRFISRRGKPVHMFSDNGTTFVGALKQLKELYAFYNGQEAQSSINEFLSQQEILWSFIPPNAPHFGGIWEAAVKSAKHHLARIVDEAHLSFEEMQTILCEIEAILNSRPITPLSEDPNDLAYLSPGHFLVGSELNSFPYSDLSDIPENRLIRWQRVEQLRQHFWRRWSNEYLQSLQKRTKWKRNKRIQLSPKQLVLIRQPNLQPLQWMLGRVEDIHPGSDGVTRAATIRTSKGSLVRPLSRLAILPIET